MKRLWWDLYGTSLRLDLSVVVLLIILALSNYANIFTLCAIVGLYSGLSVIAIKASLPLFRPHRLLGMSLVDALYEYTKSHFWGLLIPLCLIGLSHLLGYINYSSLWQLLGSLVAMYLMSSLLTYLMLRRNL